MADLFDTEAFFSALNAVRAKQGMTWKDVAAQANVNPSTLSRIGQGKKPDLNGLSALLIWSGLKAEMFMPASSAMEIDPIAKITTIIRSDRALSTNSARLIEDIVTSAYGRLRNEEKVGDE
jgi:transcriptional regulator with XRE-family HTH domain